jgi:hypothetical protein
MAKLKDGVNYLAALIVFSLLAFSGCKKPDSSIGLGIQPDSDMLSLYYTDTLTLDMVSVREDSLSTDELSSGVLGKVFHPRFGTVSARFATQLRLSATNVDFGSNPFVDSMYMSLRFSGESFGTLTPHTIMVHALVDTLVLDSTYYSNFDPEVGHDNLVDPFQLPVSLNPTGDVISGEDTLSSQLRINLSTSLGTSFLDQDTSIFSNNENWLNFFPGIVVSSASGQGAATIDLSSGLSIVRMHYHNDTDTTFYDFLISPLSARVNMFYTDFAGSLEVLENNIDENISIPGDDLLYVLSSSGVKIKMFIPHLESVNDTLRETRAVQKAELILPLDESFYDSRYPAHEQLFILTENENGDLISTPDQTSIGVNIDGFFDSEAREFRFNITRTIQQILNRNTGIGFGNFSPDRPVPPLYIVSTRAGISIQGVVIRGTGVNENKARLVLTCSH